MKKIKFITVALVFFAAFSLVSCSSDNEPIDSAIDLTGGGGTGGGGTTTIVGSYLMTEVNTSVFTDLNNDGISSPNQMNETACFNNNILTLNSNNTFTATSRGVEVVINGTGGNDTVGCFVDPNISGTWTLVNNTLTLSYIEDGDQYNDVYVVSGNKLIITTNQGEIVGNNGGVVVYLTSNIQIVFLKQ